VIVIDASLALKLVLNEADSTGARELWARWVEADEEIIVPEIFRIEMASVIRKNIHRGRLLPSDGDDAFEVIQNLDVEFREPPELVREAWYYAKRFNRPTLYDCCYVGLAALVGCVLWTADKRLVNAVGRELPWVHGFG
jgi:predicted nucleic acid-binding protein